MSPVYRAMSGGYNENDTAFEVRTPEERPSFTLDDLPFLTTRVRSRSTGSLETKDNVRNEDMERLSSSESYHSFLRLVHDDSDSEEERQREQAQRKRDKEPTKVSHQKNQDEHFYDTTDLSSPVYDRTTPDGLSEENLLTPEERAAQDEEYKADLAKLEDEIATLRQVLGAKVHQSNVLKRKLGITPWNEFKSDLNLGMKTIRESDKYQKTNAVLKTAGEKTTSAFSTMGAFTSRKLGDMRNSTTFKSFEEKMAGAYTNVKAKVRGSKSETSFEDALTAERNLETVPKATEALPEEKVPL